MIEVNGLEKRYGSFVAVHDVSFKAATGKVIGLLGPNGAGKTSIMKVLTGYHRPSSGVAILAGLDVCEDPVAVKQKVGYLAEGVPLYADMTVREYLDFVVASRNMPLALRDDAISRAALSCGLKDMDHVRIEHLSKGYRQRVGLAQAIVHDPEILILDEPTTGLDPNQIMEIRSLIRDLGRNKTVLLSTHILQEVEALCSEVIILHEGRIVAQGTSSSIAATLQGEERLVARLLRQNSGQNAERFRSALSGHPAVAGCQLDEKSPETCTFQISATTGQADQAAVALFDLAVDEGWKLLELRRESLSLEDIFVKLTTEER